MQVFRPTVIDLFAGAGGLSLGFESAGFDIIASVEIDPVHSAVHEYNFPYTKTLCQNITNVSGKDILKATEKFDSVDVLIGGAPCQGFSLIGKRALDDPRNQLVHHYIRLVKELKPKYFVFENVRGITIGKHKAFLEEMISEFKKCGYKIIDEYQVLNAKDYGVPQDRRRLFLIGARNDQVLPEYPKVLAKPVCVWDAIGDLPNIDDFDELLTSDSVKYEIKPFTRYQKILHGLILDNEDYSYPRTWDDKYLTSSMRTVHTDLSIERFNNTLPGKVEKVSRFLRLSKEGICNTLRAGTNTDRGAYTSPRPIHPIYSRVISVREAARLHSYPDWFRFHITKWHGFRQIGNSVPPLLARSVGQEIIKALGVEPSKPEIRLPASDLKLLQFDLSEAARYFSVDSNVIAKRNRLTQGSFIWEDQVIYIAK